MYPDQSYIFPYVLKDENNFNIIGELYKIKESLMDEIDIFEGVPTFYFRDTIKVNCNSQIYKAYIYFRNSNNPNSYDEELPINEWIKEFEVCGDKLEEFSRAANIIFLACFRFLLISLKIKEFVLTASKTISLEFFLL